VLEGFTKKYKINQLVFYEDYPDMVQAIAREKQLKGWTRAKKIALIEKMNPGWEDLRLF
jgi:putative endonuclease